MLDGKLAQRLDGANPQAVGDAASYTAPEAAAQLAGRGDASGLFEPRYALPRSLLVASLVCARQRLGSLINGLTIATGLLTLCVFIWPPAALAALACAITALPAQKLEHFLSSVCAEAERRRAA